MAVSFYCKCPERAKPVEQRNWVVYYRYCNHSAFESPKYGEHPSDYSTVKCLSCGAVGRTKAKYVDDLRDALPHE
jgi:hypothetical protein